MGNDYLQQLVDSWENTVPLYLFLSVPEFNLSLRRRVELIKKESVRYQYIRRGSYYVVTSREVSTTGEITERPLLVPAYFFLDFSVKVPSLVVLRQRVVNSGVPRSDEMAFSVELDALVGRYIDRAEKSLERFEGYLSTVLHPKDATFVVLETLFHELNIHRFQYKAMAHDFEDSSHNVYAYMVEDLTRQLEYLLRVMKLKHA